MAIVAAIDENERSKQVVEIAYDLATTYDDEMTALHVVPLDEYDSHRKSIEELPGFQDFAIDQEAESAERFVMKFIRETLGEIEEERIEPRGRVGNVVEEVLAEADRVNPRFLVISGRRRSPAGKAVFGNRAQRILLNADCPVVFNRDNQW